MNRNRHTIKIGLGSFRVGPKPRGGDWLDIDLRALKSEGYTFVASLLTDEENQELGLVGEALACEAIGLEFYFYPIIDRSVPPNRESFEDFASPILNQVQDGERGFFHRRAGLGRAPLLACTVLAQSGVPPDSAWKLIEESRGQVVPDTDAQRKWVRSSGKGVKSLDDALAMARLNQTSP